MKKTKQHFKDFKKDQVVKAFFLANGKADWHVCKFSGYWAKGCYCILYRSTKFIVSEENICNFNKITWDEVIEQCKPNFKNLMAIIKRGLHQVLPKVKLGTTEESETELTFSVMDSYIAIGPEWGEIRQLDCIQQVGVWGVNITHYHPGTREDPPDADEVSVGQRRSITSAAALFINTVFQDTLNNFIEHEMDLEYEAQIKDEKECDAC